MTKKRRISKFLFVLVPTLVLFLILMLGSCVFVLNFDDAESSIPEEGDAVSRYAYSSLDEDEKLLYLCIRDSVMNFDRYVKRGLGDFVLEDIYRIQNCVLSDYPEIFWLANTGSAWSNKIGSYEKITKYEFVYTITSDDAAYYRQKLTAVAESFRDTIPPGAGDYEKALMVYDYLAENIEYDMVEYERILGGDTASGYNQLLGALLDGKAVCEGYARSTQYLLNEVGIPSVYITGKSNGVSHAWNLVKLDGDYYYIDSTYGDSTVLIDNIEKPVIKYTYFGMTTNDMSRLYEPDIYFPLPYCDSVNDNYFVKTNSHFSGYDREAVKRVLRDNVLSGRNCIGIRFDSHSSYSEAYAALFNEKGEIFNILREIQTEAPSLVCDSVNVESDTGLDVIYVYLSF